MRKRRIRPQVRMVSNRRLVSAFSLLVFSIQRAHSRDSSASCDTSRRPLASDNTSIPHHERIEDPTFRRAVALIDSGDLPQLVLLLEQNPGLVRQRVKFERDSYFQNPSLLEFIAENPIRHGTLPPNIVDAAKTILRAGPDIHSINNTLGLVASGCVVRECNVQLALIELLCKNGADPNSALKSAALHGEFAAVDELQRQGAKPDLPILAALGETNEFRSRLPLSTPEQRHLSLAFASQYGHAEIVRALLDAKEDPNRNNPPGAHSHATPLHQAALAGHVDVVKLLVEHGAKLDTQDLLWKGTPRDWAHHGKQAEVETYLSAVGDNRSRA
jgi:ankyrin repeat protein